MEIVAQAILFFIAGFETSSTLLCFAAHELAINPDVQKKLQDEIDELIAEKGKTLTYNDLMKMKYMDMVISGWPKFKFELNVNNNRNINYILY